MATDDPNLFAPGLATQSEPTAPRPPARPAVFLWALFAITLGAPPALWNPVVRELLGESHSRAGAFFGTASIPLILSPLWACLIDRVPIMGTRREGYLLIGGVLAIAGWVAIPFVPQGYGPYLAVSLVLGLAAIVTSTAANGALVELGRRLGNTGLLAAAMGGLPLAAGLIVWAASGPLSTRPLGWTATWGGALGISLVVVATMFSDEREPSDVAQPSAASPSTRLRDYLRSVTFWSALAIVTPASLGVSTVLLTRVKHEVQLPDDAWWTIQRPSQFVPLVSALVYAVLSRRMKARQLVTLSLVAGGLGTLSLYALDQAPGPFALGLVLAAKALADGFVTVALFDVMLRSAPRRWEALGYLLLTGTPRLVGTLITAFSFKLALPELIGLSAALVGLAALVTARAAKGIFDPAVAR